MYEICDMFELDSIVCPLHIFPFPTFDLHLLDGGKIADVVAVAGESPSLSLLVLHSSLLLETIDHRINLFWSSDGDDFFAGVVLRIDVIAQIDIKTIIVQNLLFLLFPPIIIEVIIIKVRKGRLLLLALGESFVKVGEKYDHQVVEV
jgi:hypothetical protein